MTFRYAKLGEGMSGRTLEEAVNNMLAFLKGLTLTPDKSKDK